MPRTELRGGQILDASVDLTADVTGTLPVANGGTGSATLSNGAVLLGAGTGAVGNVAPGSANDFLYSDGSVWASGKPPLLQPGTTTGATAQVRYGPATTGGSPTTGTWQGGDIVPATNGYIFICITAGTPGTWVRIPQLSQATVPVALGTAAVGNSTLAAPINHVHPTTGLVLTVNSTAPDGTGNVVVTATPASNAWTTIGTLKMGANAASSSILALAAYEQIRIQFNITGYSGSDIAALRFGTTTSAVDTGGNYISDYQNFSGTTAFSTPTQTTATTMMRLGQNAVSTQRVGEVIIYNFSGTAHPMAIQSTTTSGGTATGSVVASWGTGNWNTASAGQIRSVQLVTQNGQNLLAGTSISVEGCNPS